MNAILKMIGRGLLILMAGGCLLLALYFLVDGWWNLDKFNDPSAVEGAVQQQAIATYAVGRLLISVILMLWAIVFVWGAESSK